MTKTLRDGEEKLLLMPPSKQAPEQEEWARCIRALNDAFRLSFTSTELYCSPGILHFDIEDQEQTLQRVRDFRNFNEENDPDMLHQRGSFEHLEQKIFWEIYCTDNSGRDEAPDPSNLDLTQRYMMIFLEDETWTVCKKTPSS